MPIFAIFFGENILNIITSVPGDSSRRPKSRVDLKHYTHLPTKRSLNDSVSSEFSPIGGLFTLGSVLKITEVAQIFWLFFPWSKIMYLF
jgi:hypothetical protein